MFWRPPLGYFRPFALKNPLLLGYLGMWKVKMFSEMLGSNSIALIWNGNHHLFIEFHSFARFVLVFIRNVFMYIFPSIITHHQPCQFRSEHTIFHWRVWKTKITLERHHNMIYGNLSLNYHHCFPWNEIFHVSRLSIGSAGDCLHTLCTEKWIITHYLPLRHHMQCVFHSNDFHFPVNAIQLTHEMDLLKLIKYVFLYFVSVWLDNPCEVPLSMASFNEASYLKGSIRLINWIGCTCCI